MKRFTPSYSDRIESAFTGRGARHICKERIKARRRLQRSGSIERSRRPLSPHQIIAVARTRPSPKAGTTSTA